MSVVIVFKSKEVKPSIISSSQPETSEIFKLLFEVPKVIDAIELQFVSWLVTKA